MERFQCKITANRPALFSSIFETYILKKDKTFKVTPVAPVFLTAFPVVFSPAFGDISRNSTK
jgi:hypothetical protein